LFVIKVNIENGKVSLDNSDEKICGYYDIKNICHEDILDKLVSELNK